MILVDISQLLVASTFVSMKKGETEVDMKKIRYMILDSLRMYRKKYVNEFGELVICCDGSISWRREVFPYYKAARKSGRETSSLNWSQIFECFNQLLGELTDNFPYHVIKIDTAEADDIIGTLVIRKRKPDERTMIISSDKDFIQLQMNDNVFQYSPIQKKLLNGVDPNEYLKEHILRGDKGDGVPNVLSSGNSIVAGIRQTPLTKKHIELWKTQGIPKKYNTRFEENTELIDLRYTPWHLQNIALERLYEEKPKGNRNTMPEYLVKHGLERLLKNIGDF
jgi:5'-3' exonuclease